MTRTKRLMLAAVLVLIAAFIPIGTTLALHGTPSSKLAQGASSVWTSNVPRTAPRENAATLTPPPTPTATPVPTVQFVPITPVPAPRPTYVSYFGTLPPGSALPGDAQCAREIAANSWEPRPENRTANQMNVFTQGFHLHNSYLAPYGYESRVTGNFTGTTDQILRWGACKWGFDEDTVRAQAVAESSWRESFLGDCNQGATQPGTNGCASVGILQIKGANIPATYPGTWPAAYSSTAFNVDFTLAVRRLCYEGKETWLKSRNALYAGGDLWGCIGRWYSGNWHDAGANQYIQKVQGILAAKTWTKF